ncbi:MAG TPA: ion transporter [Gemmatimonadales bacterium]|nr:ion transporter [Gemmatimonadales bacterium]
MPDAHAKAAPLRARLHQIIFEADTPAGRAFDLLILVAIVASVVVVMLESVPSVRARAGPTLRTLEWGFTILFTIEYALRLFTVQRPLRYAGSAFGLIDLCAILPTYLSAVFPGAQSFLVIRLLRLLRIFRVLKLAEYLRESRTLAQALRASRRKIQVFLLSTLTIVVVVGSLMYVIEGEEHGFTSIPVSIYWAVVTLTTVGYGDLAPVTPLGQSLAVLLMLTGYGIIAVPTGIVTAELARAATAAPVSSQACPGCGLGAHEHDAVYCRKCGTKL